MPWVSFTGHKPSMTDAQFPIAVISAFADAATSLANAYAQLGNQLRDEIAAAATAPDAAPVLARAPNPPPAPAPDAAPVLARAAPPAPAWARAASPAALAPVEDAPIVAGGVPLRGPGLLSRPPRLPAARAPRGPGLIPLSPLPTPRLPAARVPRGPLGGPPLGSGRAPRLRALGSLCSLLPLAA